MGKEIEMARGGHEAKSDRAKAVNKRSPGWGTLPRGNTCGGEGDSFVELLVAV